MWDEILRLAVQNGLWAVLFLGMLVYALKDSAKREKKYQDTIQELSKHLSIVNKINDDVSAIKREMYNKMR